MMRCTHIHHHRHQQATSRAIARKLGPVSMLSCAAAARPGPRAATGGRRCHRRRLICGAAASPPHGQRQLSDKQAGGQAIDTLNRRSLSKSSEVLGVVKACIDRAVRDVFAGHATVGLQGSVAKGTAVQGLSDVDFFVRLDDTIEAVTKRQRLQVADSIEEHLLSAGLSYSLRLGKNRIHLQHGRQPALLGGPDDINCCDVDVVFQRFKHHPRLLPNNKPMAASFVGKKVVQYVKLLPHRYTQLAEPLKSKFVEDVAIVCVDWLRSGKGFGTAGVVGAEGSAAFNRLLTCMLQTIAGCSPMTGAALSKAQAKVIEAGLDSCEWQQVARRVLQERAAGRSWPGL